MTKGSPNDVPAARCPPGTTPHYQRGNGMIATWCELEDGRKHGPYLEWWSRSQMRMRGQYQFGGRTGTWLSWSQTGKKLRDIEFWEGAVHGRARYFYENGGLWKAGEYRRNQEHGQWTWFHEGAGKWMEGGFIAGKKHGIWKQWARDGSLLGECSFDRGTGTEVVRFESGLVQSKVDYADGLRHGKAEGWYQTGRRAFLQGWSHGKPAGRWVTWDELGNVVKVEEHTAQDIGAPEDTQIGASTKVYQRRMHRTSRIEIDKGLSRLYAPDEATEILAAESLQAGSMPHDAFSEGEVTEFREARPDEPERLQKFYRDRNRTLLRIEAFADGKRSKTTYYRDGEPYRIQRWHPTGNLASEGELSNLERQGTWTHWHDNGQRSFIGSYTNGRPNGRFQRWNRDGLVLGQFDVLDGNGTWFDWYESGNLREQGELIHGLEEGPWNYFLETGALLRVVVYDRGRVQEVDGDDTIVT